MDNIAGSHWSPAGYIRYTARLFNPKTSLSYVRLRSVAQKAVLGRWRTLPPYYGQIEQLVLPASSPHQLPAMNPSTCTCEAGRLCASHGTSEMWNGPNGGDVSGR